MNDDSLLTGMALAKQRKCSFHRVGVAMRTLTLLPEEPAKREGVLDFAMGRIVCIIHRIAHPWVSLSLTSSDSRLLIADGRLESEVRLETSDTS